MRRKGRFRATRVEFKNVTLGVRIHEFTSNDFQKKNKGEKYPKHGVTRPLQESTPQYIRVVRVERLQPPILSPRRKNTIFHRSSYTRCVKRILISLPCYL